MTYTIMFATGECTRTGLCFASSEEKAKQKLFSQYPNAALVKVHKGQLLFDAEIIDGIPENEK